MRIVIQRSLSYGKPFVHAALFILYLTACAAPVTVEPTLPTVKPTIATAVPIENTPSPTAVVATETAVSTPTATPAPTITPAPAAIQAPTATTSYLPIVIGPPDYYVSKNGNNQDGRSWATAWNELDQINWAVIHAGQTIYLDGGSSEMVYTTPLHIQQRGSQQKPITIALADEPGRDGKAVIFGGRSTPLPYCGQLNYTYQTDNVRSTGLILESSVWVVLNGRKWGGITIHGHNGRGVRFYGDTANITLRYLEIYDNGAASQNDAGEWRPNMPGVGLAGRNITFERMLIHDNGQDAIQSMSGDNNISNFVIRESWLYNGRQHPTVNESFNHCRHSDGLQIYDGGVISGVTIEESIVGPGFTQSIILGQTDNGVGSQATVNDVVLRHSLFVKGKGLNIMSYSGIKSNGWVIDHVTSHCLNDYTGVCLWLEGSNHTITNSIFVGSRLVLPDGLDNYSGNCQWETSDFELGQTVNPLFTNVNNTDPFSLDNYALLPNSPCLGKGSSITSVSQLLSKP